MRKLFGFLFCAFVGLVCGCGGNGKEKVYDRNLRFAFDRVKWSNTQCGHLTDLALATWNNAINNGGDITSAVSSSMSEGAAKSFADGIKLDNQRIDSVAALLSDVPDSRRDCYNDFVTLASEQKAYSELALKPSGNILQYSNNVAQQKMKVSQLLSQFSMKYANILNGDRE